MIQSAQCIASTLTTSLLCWIMLIAPLLGEIWMAKDKKRSVITPHYVTELLFYVITCPLWPATLHPSLSKLKSILDLVWESLSIIRSSHWILNILLRYHPSLYYIRWCQKQQIDLAGKLPCIYPVPIPIRRPTDQPNLVYLLASTLDQWLLIFLIYVST